MLLDFLVQLVLATLFFVGTSLGGLFLLSWLRYEANGSSLRWALSYFISLCIYTALLVGALFIFADKKLVAIVLTICYFLFALGWFLRDNKNLTRDIRTHVQENKFFLLCFLLSLFSFWLQIYHTSILDEWLHRPVTQEFINHAQFPLVNPLQPEVNFIKTYHYGSHVIGGTIGFLTGLDASTSLDIFKLSNAIASLLLLYGIVLQITKNKKWAIFGMMTTFFLASSFFLLDSFTASHLKSFHGLNIKKGERWPLNIPLSFTLTGVTWVNVPLMFAWAFFLDDYFRKQIVTLKFILFAGTCFIGFFLISELFAILGLIGVGIIFLCQFYQKKIKTADLLLNGSILGIIILVGIYLTGGVMGNVLDSVKNHITQSSSVSDESIRIEDTRPVMEGEDKINSNYFIEFKKIQELGYPIGSKTLFLAKHPSYYLRTFSFEVFLIIALFFLLLRKKIQIPKYPVVISTTVIGFILPFIVHTKFGDLNLFKLTAYSLLVVHIGIFFLLYRCHSKLLTSTVVFLVVVGSISGTLLGTNIQWNIFSKNKAGLYCSQNPICYEGSGVEVLKELERHDSQRKTILVAEQDIDRVVDLTDSRVVTVGSDQDISILEGKIDYIYNSPALRNGKSEDFFRHLGSYEKVFEKGEFSVLRVR